MVKGRVLLLNGNFEVLGTIDVPRAIRMTMRDENPINIFEVVPNDYLTTGNGVKIPRPSVVGLKHNVDIRKKREESGGKRMKIYLRDGYKCQYCGIKPGKMFTDQQGKYRQFTVKDLTWDHITPKSKGGTGHPNNLVTACMKCNQRKADRNPEEARMPLLTTIHDITDIGVDNIMLCRYVEHHPEWFDYLQGKSGFIETYNSYKAMAA